MIILETILRSSKGRRNISDTSILSSIEKKSLFLEVVNARSEWLIIFSICNKRTPK